MTVEYTVIEKVPSAEAFCHLRVAAGMSPRPLEGARAGLPHSCLWRTYPLAGDADRDGTHRRRRRD
ncbi:N-acetyltransferase GCN5 [Klebsiella pneumoniae]|uniref:N-acetyltransferase GCN5 n=1 Tax=Klebsiella pneumoniae TaxID=573 RepID=A0A4P0XJV5_KLEPN|nr:N-acetyltransferase GCN5 [Klebsiella pneumoniae]